MRSYTHLIVFVVSAFLVSDLAAARRIEGSRAKEKYDSMTEQGYYVPSSNETQISFTTIKDSSDGSFHCKRSSAAINLGMRRLIVEDIYSCQPNNE